MLSTMYFKLLFFTVVISSRLAEKISSIRPVELQTEYLSNPLTLETLNPRFSWKLRATNDAGHNLTQTAYQILVSSNASLTDADLWDSGVVKSDATTHIRYGGKALKSRQLATWKVKVWDQNGVMAESVTNGQFGMGLLHRSDWKAKWVAAPIGMQSNVAQTLQSIDQSLIKDIEGLAQPALYYRKSFQLQETVGAFRLFATAKGIYEIYLNGNRLGKSYFTPGYTDYNSSIRYQSYESVERHLNKGENVIGIVVAPGWYSGYIGYDYRPGHFGFDIGPLVQLDLNGTTLVKSDGSWLVTTGPIVYSDILMGETYYVEKELKGWNNVKYNDTHWKQVIVRELNPQVELLGDVSEPVVVSATLTPKSMHEHKPGVFIFDFGQNFAGVCSLTIPAGHPPARIQLRHGEVLENPFMNGSLYTENLRSARATDTVVIKDKLTQSFTYTPSFTYHGFRFVELSGFVGVPKLTDLVGNVMHSGVTLNSHMTTSNEHVNRLLLNIEWSLRSNFFSVPTDCPQRAERLGWTADASVFAPTAVYNAQLAAFYTKWMVDMRQAQKPNGAIPDTVPRFDSLDGSPGWQDAVVLIPWVVYRAYGDEQIIKDNYDAMSKFLDHVQTNNPGYIWNKFDHSFGVWMEVNELTDKEVVSTAGYARDAMLMSKMASVIGKVEDAQMYAQLFHNITDAFNAHFVRPDGTIQSNTQSAYVISLAYSLLPEKIRPLAVQKLVDNLQKRNNHLTTGVLAVGLLNPVLTEHGHNELAYKLLLQDSYPSWLYPIVHANATTIWERWDGWTEQKGFQLALVNSFNHYALGSMGVWLYSQVAGIGSDGAGFKRIIIKPQPGPGLTRVNASYDSIHGVISSSWTITGDIIQYKITIPVNTKAKIILPGEESNKVVEVGSGTWEFSGKKNF